MRLICGVFQLDGRDASETMLHAMVARMDVPRLRPAHRLWRAGPVGLAVLDFSARGATSLPEIAGVTIAADVRLDQPEIVRGWVGATATEQDDALLLAHLNRTGPSDLSRVLGDFAFAQWHGGNHHLTCGRDVFGIRPLSYVHLPGRLFAFASLPEALWGSGIVSKRVDVEALARRTAFMMRFDDSLVAGIQRLPPGHTIEVSRDRVALRRYWQLDRTAVGNRDCPPEEAARTLRGLVEEAIACRLPRTGEIGAHLSGGLDSSALSVLAARQLHQSGRRLRAYSFLDRQRNDITLEDETEFVKAVLAQEGDIDWTPIRLAAGAAACEGALDADKMKPLGAEEPDNAVCLHAEAQGVGLVLSGWGGDEAATFNGRGSFAELFLRGRWRKLGEEMSALKRERGWTVATIFRSEVLRYVLPNPVLNLARRLAGKKGGQKRAAQMFLRLMSTDIQDRIAASSRPMLAMVASGEENRWRLMTSPHIAERAEDWAQMGARHGLAFAFPLLDRRVVEFALSLPSALFLRGGFRRRLFRDAMVDVLPEAVRLRHQKFQPFPSHMIDLAESRDEFLARIDRYAQNNLISRTIDLKSLRKQVEAFPSPDQVRAEMHDNENPQDVGSMLTVSRILTMAAYLEQHGGDQE